MSVEEIEEAFPELAHSNYQITSDEAFQYNCVAWAIGLKDRWVWPELANGDEDWPSNLDRDPTLGPFLALFRLLGYEECDPADVEDGFQRIAIFTDDNGIVRHVARQLESGAWTSKLGDCEDIEHHLRALEGWLYGTVSLIMRRRGT